MTIANGFPITPAARGDSQLIRWPSTAPVGIAGPAIGITAVVGLVLFFVGAIVTHIRGHFYEFTLPAIFLALAVAALVLRLATA